MSDSCSNLFKGIVKCPELCSKLFNHWVNTFTTVKTIKLREAQLLQHIIDQILEEVNETKESFKEMLIKPYMHPQCSYAIEKLILKYSIVFTNEEYKNIQRVLSADYNLRSDLEEMADILESKVCENKELKRELDILFAIDGFSTELKYKFYIDNLAVKLEEDSFVEVNNLLGQHVQAIRNMYVKNEKMTPLRVHEVLFEVYQNNAYTLDNIYEIYRKENKTDADSYVSFIGQTIEVVKNEVIRPKIEKEQAEVERISTN